MPVNATVTHTSGSPAMASVPLPPSPHAHHWRIAEANGATSPGVCRICGMERVFENWEKEPEAAQRGLPGAGQRRAASGG